MTRLTAKSSTIFIATRESTQVFHSMQEVPEAYRRKLRDSARSGNMLTILIADRLGRQELVRALQAHRERVSGEVAGRGSRTPLTNGPAENGTAALRLSSTKRAVPSLRTWVELLLPIAVGASLWFLIGSHF